jgi:hypothetical protein
LVAVAIAMVMAPAAYHRQRGPESVRESMIRVASRLLLFAMFPLMAAFGLEFFLIARVITNRFWFSVTLALLLVIVFSAVWFILPRSHTMQKIVGGKSKRGNW